MLSSLLTTKLLAYYLLIYIYTYSLSKHTLLHPSSSSSSLFLLTLVLQHQAMDFFETSSSSSSSTISTSSSSLSLSSSIVGVWSGRARSGGNIVCQMLRRTICAIVTCVFALVGSVVGAVTGALIGLATESGLFRGAGIGAISGAVFAIEVVESSLVLWRSNGPGIWSFLYLIDIISSLLSGRLVREKLGPAVQSAVQSQMSAVDLPFAEAIDLFETGGTRGMSKDSLDKLPKINITDENHVDPCGEKICCSVCLQDFQEGDTVRSLPHCKHMFHLSCIDSWLTRQGSCPLCRRDI